MYIQKWFTNIHPLQSTICTRVLILNDLADFHTKPVPAASSSSPALLSMMSATRRSHWSGTKLPRCHWSAGSRDHHPRSWLAAAVTYFQSELETSQTSHHWLHRTQILRIYSWQKYKRRVWASFPSQLSSFQLFKRHILNSREVQKIYIYIQLHNSEKNRDWAVRTLQEETFC